MFKILDFTNENLIAFQVKGRIEESDFEALNLMIRNARQNYDTLRLYLEIDNIEGTEPAALWRDVKTYIRHGNDLNKIAVVAPDDVLKSLTESGNPFSSGELRYFKLDELISARDWVME